MINLGMAVLYILLAYLLKLNQVNPNAFDSIAVILLIGLAIYRFRKAMALV